MSLFAVKPLNAILADSEKDSLKRSLGPGQLVALGIGAIIGAGLFSITGTAAAQNAGPAVVLSFLLASVGCAFAGICYSEFSTMLPIAGSAYTYSYATMGELVAWIIGWDLVLEYAIGASTVAVSWSGYVVSFLKDFGITLPAQLVASPFEPVKTSRHGYCADRHHQFAGFVHRRGDFADPDPRHPGIGAREQRHCGPESIGRAVVYRIGLVLHQPRQLHAVHSAQHRSYGRVWF